jgi:hypothetical protein
MQIIIIKVNGNDLPGKFLPMDDSKVIKCERERHRSFPQDGLRIAGKN